MRKIIIAMLVCVPTLFLNGCYVTAAPDNYYYSSYRPYYSGIGWGGGYSGWYGRSGWGHGGWGHHGGWGYGGHHGGWGHGAGHWHR